MKSLFRRFHHDHDEWPDVRADVRAICGRGAAAQPSSLINEFLARTRSGCLHRGARGSAETPATRHVPPARTRSSLRRQGSPLHGTCDVGRRSRPDLPCAKPSPPLERGLEGDVQGAKPVISSP
ncbi:unnamed protein product [Cercospora beticola]|nr:unnamed protein product [Cercospora beticola]